MIDHNAVLVLAPHNDDEVLGPGGVIQQHRRRGERVAVVLLTNGDGQYRRFYRSRTHAVRLGYRRQRETRAALAELGVGEDEVSFLGYPDRGLAALWNRCWDFGERYTSPRTGADRSPYDNSPTRQAPYCGKAVIEDLQRILQAGRFHTIYLPHPNDLHPDHWAAHALTTYALEAMDPPPQARLWTYVVHRGRWPLPRGTYPKAALDPPRALAALDTHWCCVPLAPEETERKLRALQQHRTQMRYMRRYLASFARRNDLFGAVPPLRLGSTVNFRDSSDALAHEDDHALASYLDPRRRNLLRDVRRFNDIREVRLRKAGGAFSIEVACFDRLRARHGVYVHLKPIPAGAHESLRFVRGGRALTCNDRPAPAGCESTADGDTFRLRFPLDWLEGARKFVVGAELTRGGASFAKCAYRLVELR